MDYVVLTKRSRPGGPMLWASCGRADFGWTGPTGDVLCAAIELSHPQVEISVRRRILRPKSPTPSTRRKQTQEMHS